MEDTITTAIKTKADLIKAYPKYAQFLEKMYACWMRAMASDKGDELPAGLAFIRNFTQAVPNESSVQHLVEYCTSSQDGQERADATACFIIMVATDSEGSLPQVDTELYTGWRDTRPKS